MPKTVLVTGANGFVGHHLVRELTATGHQVLGVGLQPRPSPQLKPLLESYTSVDLTDIAAVSQLPLAKADAIISLAGLANVGESFDKPELYMRVNTGVIETVCQVLLKTQQSSTRHLIISTGAVYDPSAKPPFDEDSKLVKDSAPYVLSKIAAEKIGLDYKKKGLDIVIARPFNHIGPGQEPGFILPDLVSRARQAIAAGSNLKVGNLSTKRDYTDVRDVARAYRLLALAGSLDHPLYNICSGRSLAGEELLKLALASLAPDQRLKIEVDKTLFRPADAADIYGSSARLRGETGWQPQIPIEQTIKDFVAAS